MIKIWSKSKVKITINKSFTCMILSIRLLLTTTPFLGKAIQMGGGNTFIIGKEANLWWTIWTYTIFCQKHLAKKPVWLAFIALFWIRSVYMPASELLHVYNIDLVLWYYKKIKYLCLQWNDQPLKSSYIWFRTIVRI